MSTLSLPFSWSFFSDPEVRGKAGGWRKELRMEGGEIGHVGSNVVSEVGVEKKILIYSEEGGVGVRHNCRRGGLMRNLRDQSKPLHYRGTETRS